MAKLEIIIGKVLGGEWGTDDEFGTGIPVLRTTNFTNDGVINFTSVVTRTIAKKDLSEKYLHPGDIIIEKSGGSDKQPVGRVVYYDGEPNIYLFNNFTGVLRVKDSSCWDSKYLFYVLYANYLRGGTRKYQNKTTGLHNLKTDQYIKEFEVPEYPLQEQQQIVITLDKLTALISLRKQQLAKLDELVKARFVEMMSSAELSKKTTIKEITESVKVGFVGICEKYYTEESGVPMLRTGNITENGIDLKDLKYVTAEFHKKNKKSQIHEGNLLIARHGSNGQANVYFGPEAQCLNAVIIVPKQDVACSLFLAGLINSPAVKEQIDRTLVGSTQHVVNTKSIAGLKVRIPDILVQKQYEAFVKQTDKSKLKIQQSLDKMEILKKSLMQECFG